MKKKIVTSTKKTKEFLSKHKHTNWTLADQVVVSGSNFLLGIILARVLGISEFGIYSLALLIVLFANEIQQSAIISPMMSIGPKQKKDDENLYYGSVCTQAFLFAIISFISTFLGVKLLSSYAPDWNISALALPLSINIFLVQLQDFIRRYFYTIEKPKLSFLTDVIRFIGYITVLITTYMFSSTELTTEDAFWISSLVTLVSIIFLLTHFMHLSLSLEIFKITIKRHWDFSKWLTASTLMQWFFGNIYTIIAGTMIGTSAVGALKAAQSLLGVTHILFMALANIVPIKSAKMYAKGNIDEMKKYLINTGIIGVACVIAVSLIFAVYPEFWFRILFGEEFVPYAYLIRYISVFYILMAMFLPIKFALRTMEHTKIIFYAHLLITILSAISVIWMTQTFGIIAQPIASIANTTILIIITLIYLRKISSNKDKYEKDL